MILKSKEILDEESESLISLSRLGYDFRQYAVSNLLTIHSCYSECRYWMLMSALARQDARAARIYLQDWKYQDKLPKAKISKFIPGEHYYVLNNKFNSLEEAKNYLHEQGYIYAGFEEVYTYTKIGD